MKSLPPICRRVLPAAIGGLLFLTLAALWLAGAEQQYTAFFRMVGVRVFRVPFLDTHALLAAIECHRLGVDVYTSNPCDILGRLHVYSPVWLHLGVLPVTTGWTNGVGLALDVGFLISLVMLPPARRTSGTLVMTIGIVSPAVIFALERANNDVLIFLLAMMAGLLATQSARLRLGGQLLIIVASALKFYPVTLLILNWRERWPRCLGIVALSLLALAACLLPERDNLLRALRLIPTGIGDTFGAINLPIVLSATFRWPPWSRLVLLAGLLAVMGLRAVHLSYRLQPNLRPLPEPERVFLTIGATLIVSCFLAGQSVSYRAIHLLFTLPALISLTTGRSRNLALTAITFVIAVMWADGLRVRSGSSDIMLLLLADELAWWVVVTILLAVLLALLRDSVAWTSLFNARSTPGSGLQDHPPLVSLSD